MKISTFSIVVGNAACNAKCPFCVSRMTGFEEVSGKNPRSLSVVDASGSAHPDLPNFESAVRLAQIAGTTTVLLTGKGEPTLFPDEITYLLQCLRDQGFPFVELQTNGLTIGRAVRELGRHRDGVPLAETPQAARDAAMLGHLHKWRLAGLNTVAVSVVSERDGENAEVYDADYPSLAATVDYLHQVGFTVRLSLMLVRGFVSSAERLQCVIDWCRERGVEQLTVRPIRQPTESDDAGASDFVRERGVTWQQEDEITHWVKSKGTRVLTLSHGAAVFDVDGQNVCLTDCLTVPDEADQIRTLIYYTDGRLAYDWQHRGAVLLGGRGYRKG